MPSLHSCCGAASVLGASRPFALATTPRVYERARPFTIERLALDLELDVERKSVRGVATLDIVRVDVSATEIALDAVGFEIESVELVGQRGVPRRSTFTTAARSAFRSPPRSRARSFVSRTALTPKRGLYFLEPDEHVHDRPRQVWTQCQDEDARHSFPATTSRTSR